MNWIDEQTGHVMQQTTRILPWGIREPVLNKDTNHNHTSPKSLRRKLTKILDDIAPEKTRRPKNSRNITTAQDPENDGRIPRLHWLKDTKLIKDSIHGISGSYSGFIGTLTMLCLWYPHSSSLGLLQTEDYRMSFLHCIHTTYQIINNSTQLNSHLLLFSL